MHHLFSILLLSVAAPLYAQGHGQCTDCHAQGSVNDQAVMATVHPALPQLCIDCHQARLDQGEHVVNIKPVTAQPRSLPLLEGRVSCTTCHDPHGKTPAQLRLNAAQLCQDCHNQ